MRKAANKAPAIGQVLAGKYRVEKILGSGGMGTVVAAMHVDLQELRAIKLMHPDHAGDASSVERFFREARAAVRLRSDHVARVHDVGRLDSGAPYIVMEHLVGSDLGEICKRRGPLPIQEAALYVIQAASAVAEAHSLGIVHRDLKPSNLFLTTARDGSPCIKVLDFGISKLSGPDGDGSLDMTKPGELVGSPLYMAPEQMRSCSTVDARIDVWGLGVILYKLVTGKLPFFATGLLEVCTAVIERPPPSPSSLRPGLPPELEAVILRCLAKNPDDRFADAPALAAALEPFLSARPGGERISLDVVVDQPEPSGSVKAQTAAPLRIVEIEPVGVEPAEEVEALPVSRPFSLSRRRKARPAPAPVKRRPRSALAVAVSVLAGVILSAVTLAGTGALLAQHQKSGIAREVVLARLAAARKAAAAAAAAVPIQSHASAPAKCPVEQKRASYVPGRPDDPFRLLER